MKYAGSLLFLLLCLAPGADARFTRPESGGGSGVSLSGEEFSGPFSSWINVKTGKTVDGVTSVCLPGAVGDNTADDTAAIQLCLNALGSSRPVLYFPDAIYKITHTLSLQYKEYVSLVGEDPTAAAPSTTKIRWGGVASTTPAASFTGTITNNCATFPDLSVASSSGTIRIGQRLNEGSGTLVYVTSYVTGSGGNGTYKLSAFGQGCITSGTAAMTTTDEDMLFYNGQHYSNVSRLTFDGGNLITTLINETWVGPTQPFFDTGNQFSDVAFTNAKVGFTCGNLGFGCADISMIRNQFIGLTEVGCVLQNANALDVYVWYSLFQNNPVGCANSSATYTPYQGGAGSFHVMNSKFLTNTYSDILINNTGTFNFGFNYSLGSTGFISSTGASNSVNNVTLVGNVILDPSSNTNVVYSPNIGPLAFIGNIVRSLGGSGPIVHVPNSTYPSDAFSFGNTYTVGTAGTCGSIVQVSNGGHCHSISDQIVSSGSINPPVPVLPPTPPNLGRQIFEPAAFTSAAINTAITAAAACGCVNPTVHLPFGAYTINTTLSLPANFPMQVIGDGANTALNASGLTGPVMKLNGPSKVVLREFLISGNAHANDGIEVTSADQAGAQIFIDQPHPAINNVNMLVDSLDRAAVEIHVPENTQATGSPGIGLQVIGGTSAAGGSWLGGYTNVFGGVTFNQTTGADWDVSNGAHATVWGPWRDSGSTAVPAANISGPAGAFTFAGSTLYDTAEANIVTASGYPGTISLVGLLTNGDVAISGVSTGSKTLGLALTGPSNGFFNYTATGGAMEFLNGFSKQTPLPPLTDAVELPELNCCNTPFLTSALAQLQAAVPVVPLGTAASITDVRMYRIFVYNAAKGFWIH